MLEREEAKEEEEKWVKYYSSFHQILLVGEGDFSFSMCLALSFASATNIVASSLDSYVDATKMKLHHNLKMRKFDRIIYNFPHAGFYGKEDDMRLIRKHMNLVKGFFRNGRGMLRRNGEIHVNHKTTVPFCHWNLEELASKYGLFLIETVPFNKDNYPGYNNKRGSGSRCDEAFPLGPCSTFKFKFSPTAKKVTKIDSSLRRSQEIIEASTFVHRQPIPIELRQPVNFITSNEILVAPQPPSCNNFCQPPPNFILCTSGVPLVVGSPSTPNASTDWSTIFKGHLDYVVEAFGSNAFQGSFFLNEALRLGYGRYVAENPGRTASDYASAIEEIRLFSLAKQALSRRIPVTREYQLEKEQQITFVV